MNLDQDKDSKTKSNKNFVNHTVQNRSFDSKGSVKRSIVNYHNEKVVNSDNQSHKQDSLDRYLRLSALENVKEIKDRINKAVTDYEDGNKNQVPLTDEDLVKKVEMNLLQVDNQMLKFNVALLINKFRTYVRAAGIRASSSYDDLDEPKDLTAFLTKWIDESSNVLENQSIMNHSRFDSQFIIQRNQSFSQELTNIDDFIRKVALMKTKMNINKLRGVPLINIEHDMKELRKEYSRVLSKSRIEREEMKKHEENENESVKDEKMNYFRYAAGEVYSLVQRARDEKNNQVDDLKKNLEEFIARIASKDEEIGKLYFIIMEKDKAKEESDEVILKLKENYNRVSSGIATKDKAIISLEKECVELKNQIIKEKNKNLKNKIKKSGNKKERNNESDHDLLNTLQQLAEKQKSYNQLQHNYSALEKIASGYKEVIDFKDQDEDKKLEEIKRLNNLLQKINDETKIKMMNKSVSTQTDQSKEDLIAERHEENAVERENKTKKLRDSSLSSEKDKFVESEKDNLVEIEKEILVESEKDNFVKSEKDILVESEKDKFVESEKDKFVESEKDNLVEIEKDILVEIEKDILVESEKDILVESEKDNFVKSEKDNFVKSEKDIFVKSEKDIFVKSEKDIFVKSEKDIFVESEKGIWVESEKDNFVESEIDNKVNSHVSIQLDKLDSSRTSFIDILTNQIEDLNEENIKLQKEIEKLNEKLAAQNTLFLSKIESEKEEKFSDSHKIKLKDSINTNFTDSLQNKSTVQHSKINKSLENDEKPFVKTNLNKIQDTGTSKDTKEAYKYLKNLKNKSEKDNIEKKMITEKYTKLTADVASEEDSERDVINPSLNEVKKGIDEDAIDTHFIPAQKEVRKSSGRRASKALQSYKPQSYNDELVATGQNKSSFSPITNQDQDTNNSNNKEKNHDLALEIGMNMLNGMKPEVLEKQLERQLSDSWKRLLTTMKNTTTFVDETEDDIGVKSHMIHNANEILLSNLYKKAASKKISKIVNNLGSENTTKKARKLIHKTLAESESIIINETKQLLKLYLEELNDGLQTYKSIYDLRQSAVNSNVEPNFFIRHLSEAKGNFWKSNQDRKKFRIRNGSTVSKNLKFFNQDVNKRRTDDLIIATSNKIKFASRNNNQRIKNTNKKYRSQSVQHPKIIPDEFLKVSSIRRHTIADPESSSQTAQWETIKTKNQRQVIPANVERKNFNENFSRRHTFNWIHQISEPNSKRKSLMMPYHHRSQRRSSGEANSFRSDHLAIDNRHKTYFTTNSPKHILPIDNRIPISLA